MLPVLLAQFIFAGALAAQPFLNFHVQYHDGHYSGWSQAWSSDGNVTLQFTDSWDPSSQLTISNPDSATATGNFQWDYNHLMAANPWDPANWSMTHNGSPVEIAHVEAWGGKEYSYVQGTNAYELGSNGLKANSNKLTLQLYGSIGYMDESIAQNFDIQLWDGNQYHLLTASINEFDLELDLSGISLTEGSQYSLFINYHSHSEMVVRGYADDWSILFDGIVVNDSGFNENINFTVVAPAAVPEPATYAALAGAVLLAVSIWRRRGQRS